MKRIVIIGAGFAGLSTALTYLTDEVWRRDNLTTRGENLVDTMRFEERRATGVRLVGGKEIDADS
jgi:choline dehydrogenase